MLVLDCDVVVGQHRHVFDLALIFLTDRLAESFLVLVQVVQTSFDSLDGLFVEIEVRQNDAFVDIGRGD